MTSDPNEEGAGVSVSIKQPPSKQYAADGMWLVLHGSVERVREDIIKAFGIEVEGEPTLYDLAIQADSIAHSTRQAARTLGAKTAPQDNEVDASSAWAQARSEQGQAKEPEPEVSESDKLLARIGETADVPGLRDLYARNEALFKENAELLEAWKAKGRELSTKKEESK